MPPFFKDFGKSAKDLLEKNYGFDDHKIELSTQSKDTTFNAEWSAKAAAKLETEFKLPNSTSLNIEALSDNKVTATLKLKDALPGATLKSKASTNNKIFVGVEYIHALGSFTGELDHDLVKGSVLTASGLVSQKKFNLGGSVKLLPNSGLAEYVLGGGYEEKGAFELTAKLSENIEKSGPAQLLLQYIHYARPDLTYAARFSRSLEETPKVSTMFSKETERNLTPTMNISSELS